MRACVIILISLACSSAALADKTNWGEINQVIYDGSDDTLLFMSAGKWQVTGDNNRITCEPAYVRITNIVLGRDKILSIGLSAKMARSNVQFSGSCSSDSKYFDATSVYLR